MTTRSTDQPVQPDTARGPVVPVVPPVTSPVKSARPHPWEMVEHPFKTLRFVNDLRQDPHISLVRKLLYLVPMLLAPPRRAAARGHYRRSHRCGTPSGWTSHQSAGRCGHRLGVSRYRRLCAAGYLSPCGW